MCVCVCVCVFLCVDTHAGGGKMDQMTEANEVATSGAGSTNGSTNASGVMAADISAPPSPQAEEEPGMQGKQSHRHVQSGLPP